MRTTKTLTGLGECPGRSESSLGAHHFFGFVKRWLKWTCPNLRTSKISKLDLRIFRIYAVIICLFVLSFYDPVNSLRSC